MPGQISAAQALQACAKAREIIREQGHEEYEKRLDQIVASGQAGYPA